MTHLDWLIGTWLQGQNGQRITETWTRTSERTLEGISHALTPDGSAKVIEELRIVAMLNGIYYIAMVSHNPRPVCFHLTDMDENRVVFENPDHDFPRKLTYTLVAEEKLQVDLEGLRKGESIRITMEFRKTLDTL